MSDNKFDPKRPARMKKSKIPVEIVYTDLRGPWKIAAIYKDEDGEKVLEKWKENGRYHHDSAPHPKDLENIPLSMETWVNGYPNGVATAHSTREGAEACADHRRICCQKVILEEGRFDE